MVMEVVESLESSQVGDGRELFATMVLPVVHKGEIVVSGIQPEDEKGGDPGRQHEPEQSPDAQRPRHDDEERRADQCSGLCVVLRVTPARHGGWAVQEPPMHDVLEQSRGHESQDDHAAGHDAGTGEPMEPKDQKCQRGGQVAEHRDPVIGSAVDDSIKGADHESSRPSGHQSLTLYPFGYTRVARGVRPRSASARRASARASDRVGYAGRASPCDGRDLTALSGVPLPRDHAGRIAIRTPEILLYELRALVDG